MIIVLLFSLFLASLPFNSDDFFWQIKAGRDTFKDFPYIFSSQMTFHSHGGLFLNHSFLGHYILYHLHRVIGSPFILKFLLALAVFLPLMFISVKRPNPLMFFLLPFSVYLFSYFFDLRSTMIGFILIEYAVLLLLSGKRVFSPAVFILFTLSVLSHPSYIVLYGIIFVYYAHHIVLTRNFKPADAVHLVPYTAAVFLHPFGLPVLKDIFTTQAKLRPFQESLVEWLPLSDKYFAVSDLLTVYIAFLFLVALSRLIFGKKEIDLADIFLPVFAVLPFFAVRHIVFFAIYGLFYISLKTELPQRAKFIFAAFSLGMLFIFTRGMHYTGFDSRYVRDYRLGSKIPQRTMIGVLQKVQGRIFNDYGIGGYLALYGIEPFIDGTDSDPAVYAEYRAMKNGPDRTNIAELLAMRYGITAFVVPTYVFLSGQPDSLPRYLAGKGAGLIYIDSAFAVLSFEKPSGLSGLDDMSLFRNSTDPRKDLNGLIIAYVLNDRVLFMSAWERERASPYPGRAFFWRGKFHLKNGEFAEAMHYLHMAAGYFGRNPDIFVTMARTAEELGEDPLPYYKKAYSLFPQNTDILAEMANACLKTGDRKSALKYFLKLRKRIGTDRKLNDLIEELR